MRGEKRQSSLSDEINKDSQGGCRIFLQPLLATCKHNPLFSILHDKQANLYLLYYGAELLETFPDVPAHFAFRLSAGRLYNAGVKRSSLCGAFGLDIRTIARIGKAMSLPDPDELMVLLRGRQRPRKLTPEIQCFIREMMETAFELHPQAPSRYLCQHRCENGVKQPV